MTEVRIAIACEDRGHFRTITRLIDASCLTAHAWLDGVVDHCRRWHGLDEAAEWYKYDPEDANDLRPIPLRDRLVSPQGHIRGVPLKPEAGMWRKVLMLFCNSVPRPDIVLLVRDLDGYPSRRDGLEQVRDGFEWPFRIVAAMPQPEIEAWLVAGFVPGNTAEKAALTRVRETLGFDPVTRSHLLTSHPNDARTDAKVVLHMLTEGDEDRHERCLVDHGRLRDHGAHNGLGPFLDEVEARIVGMFGAPTG